MKVVEFLVSLVPSFAGRSERSVRASSPVILVVQTETGLSLRFERGVGIVRRFQCLDSGKWLEVPRKEL